MDFGDILNDWDAAQKKANVHPKGVQKSHKKANAPTKEEKEAARQGYSYEQQMRRDNARHANPMEVWLNRYGTVDKDKIADAAAEEQKYSSLEYLKTIRPQAFVDLHGLTRDEAWAKLEAVVDDAARRGFKKILIIHGKGSHSVGSDPVLGPMVKLFIAQDSRLGASGHPDRNHGGNGATWVILR